MPLRPGHRAPSLARAYGDAVPRPWRCNVRRRATAPSAVGRRPAASGPRYARAHGTTLPGRGVLTSLGGQQAGEPPDAPLTSDSEGHTASAPTTGERPQVRRQRIGAYGIARDATGRLLLVRAAPYLTVAGRWFLPGGGVEHGETPAGSLRREVAEETGLDVETTTLLGVLSDTWPLPDGSLLHTVRLVYRIDAWSGTLRHEHSGSSDRAQWFSITELAGIELVRYARDALVRFGSQLGVALAPRTAASHQRTQGRVAPEDAASPPPSPP